MMKPVYSRLNGKRDAKNLWQRLRAFYDRIRARARDYNLCSITQCANMTSYAGIVGAPGVAMADPTIFISNSPSPSPRDHDNYYREFMRAASQRERTTAAAAATKLSGHRPFPRSLSTPADRSQRYQLGVGRIDEECPSYFSASFKKTPDEDILPRSRSCSDAQNLNLSERRNCSELESQ